MTKKSTLVIALILLASWALLLMSNHPTLTISGPLIRETQPVYVNGATEMWQLQWHAPPRPRCDILDRGWFTVACQGFVYAEAGLLDLVRYRNGNEYERLPLTPFFSGFPEHEAVVKRWPKQKQISMPRIIR
ncbi:MAG TPA: hypothetical protein VGK48_11620 [Terriglobia bacterium]|jgi:hypothetical protein